MKGFGKILLSAALGLHASQGLAESELRLIPPYASRIAPLEFQAEGGDEKNFRYLAAQCWLPPSGEIRGILCVVLHPDGDNGRTLAEPESWRQLAAANQCALLGVSIVESADPTKHWFQAAEGSGEALLQTIDHFAKTSGHPELARTPIALAGVCAAGQFAYEFAGFVPSRVSCFVTIGGAKHDFGLVRAVLRVPGLLVATPDRGVEAASNLGSLKLWGAVFCAPWSGVEGRICDYDAGRSQPLVLSFLKQNLAAVKSGIFLENRSVIALGRVIEGEIEKSSGEAFSGLPSFLGEPLPVLASLGRPPSEVKVSPGNTTVNITFGVCEKLESGFDSIEIAHSAVTKVQFAEVSDREWRVELTVDPSGIPSGSFQFELPVRFSRRGISLLGGMQVPIKGTVERDIYPAPRVVRFEADSVDTVKIVTLKSRSGVRISELVVECVHPENVAVEVETENGPGVTIKKTMAANGSGKVVAGYLILRGKSNSSERLKIPFYGKM